MSECVNCAKLPGHLRDICEGTDNLSSEMRAKYLDKWLRIGRVELMECGDGATPITQPPKAGKELRRVNVGPKPGTELTKRLEAWAEKIPGIKKGCQSCKDLAAQMDRQGIAWCRQNRTKLIEQIIENGSHAHKVIPAAVVKWFTDKKLTANQQTIREAITAMFDGACKVPVPRKASRRKTLTRNSGATLIKGRTTIPVVFRKPKPYQWAAFGTVSGRPVESWQTTVATVMAAGWDTPHLFVEPDVPKPAEYSGSWTQRPATITPQLFHNLGPDGKFGALQNYVQTLNDVLAIEPDADMFFYFQDDILCPPGLREFIESVSWPDSTSLLSLWRPSSPQYCCGDSPIVGLCKTPNSSIMGAQAYVMPRATVELLAKAKTMHEWTGRPRSRRPIATGHMRRTFDFATGETLYQNNKSYFYFTDSVVDHFEPAPRNSSIGNAGASKGVFRSFGFVGADATADTMREHFAAAPVHVVILGYNLSRLTVSCIEAVRASTVDCHICYVDNGSTAEDRATVYESLQGCSHEIIENETNMQYTYAAQQGLDRRNGRHVLMLNNDCRVKPDTIETMLHAISGPNVASVCPTSSDQSTCSAAKKENQGTGLRDVPQLPWFCGLLHRAAISILPDLPTDDILASGLCLDYWWSEQLKRKGWRHYIALDAFAEHDHHATFTATGIDLTPPIQKKIMQRYKTWKAGHAS